MKKLAMNSAEKERRSEKVSPENYFLQYEGFSVPKLGEVPSRKYTNEDTLSKLILQRQSKIKSK